MNAGPRQSCSEAALEMCKEKYEKREKEQESYGAKVKEKTPRMYAVERTRKRKSWQVGYCRS
ncbi:hypothetical protein GOP47_0024608 [Adiantum capillus-veneris]|uniref:Uncharacterized protein n=1 Tax=Adiantum capillus-veneris TaxID=13818 RepID=A0A9D4Z2U5_ADICA|nr:hypothetical protein GOP47_0024608 [Adiantum capillus-veneris]